MDRSWSRRKVSSAWTQHRAPKPVGSHAMGVPSSVLRRVEGGLFDASSTGRLNRTRSAESGGVVGRGRTPPAHDWGRTAARGCREHARHGRVTVELSSVAANNCPISPARISVPASAERPLVLRADPGFRPGGRHEVSEPGSPRRVTAAPRGRALPIIDPGGDADRSGFGGGRSVPRREEGAGAPVDSVVQKRSTGHTW